MSGNEKRTPAPESSARDGHTRYSGIELLRVFAACAVVFLHYNDGRAFVALRTLDNQYWLANKLILYFGESLCICAVDLFILISGFFLSGSSRRSIDKPLRLLLQVVLFRLGMYLAHCVKDGSFSLRSFLFCFVPVNYFVVLYCALYFISPYINRAVAGFGRKEWRTLLLIALLIFSVYQTGVDVFQEIVGRQIMGLSPIGAWGGQQGFNIVNFCLMYIIGAYLRHCDSAYGGGIESLCLRFLPAPLLYSHGRLPMTGCI